MPFLSRCSLARALAPWIATTLFWMIPPATQADPGCNDKFEQLGTSPKETSGREVRDQTAEDAYNTAALDRLVRTLREPQGKPPTEEAPRAIPDLEHKTQWLSTGEGLEGLLHRSEEGPVNPNLVRLFERFDENHIEVDGSLFSFRTKDGQVHAGRLRSFDDSGKLRIRLRDGEAAYFNVSDIDLSQIRSGVSIPELHEFGPQQTVSIQHRYGETYTGKILGYRTKSVGLLQRLFSRGNDSEGDVIFQVDGMETPVTFRKKDIIIDSVKRIDPVPRPTRSTEPRVVKLGEDQIVHEGPFPEEHVALMQKYHLLPKHTIRVGETTFHLTDIIKTATREAVIAVVEQNGVKTLRAFYFSKSQGEFRVLPAVRFHETYLGERNYEKLIDEVGLEPPSEVTDFLNQKRRAREVRSDIPDVDGKKLYEEAPRVLMGVREIEAYPESPHYPGKQLQKISIVKPVAPSHEIKIPQEDGPPRVIARPSAVKIADPMKAPDFSVLVRSGRVNHKLAGSVESLTYLSKDKTLEYTVYKDFKNRIWIGKIQPKDPQISSLGVPSMGIEAGDLTRPLWEYDVQVPKWYRGDVNMFDDVYVLNWRYLRRIETIKDWYKVTGTEMPK